MSNEVIERGIISGRMPDEKDWALYFLELTSTHLHFFEGHGTSVSRKHLRSREIKGSDEVGEKKGPQKNIFNFYLSNVDGKYVFQCGSEDERDKWIRRITAVKDQRSSNTASVASKSASNVKQKIAVGQRASQPSVGNHARDSRSSVSSTDSGFGPSTDGEVSRQQPFIAVKPKPSSSTPSSGDGSVERKKIVSSHSDGGRFSERDPTGSTNGLENLNNYSWYWDSMSRQDAEKKLEEEGKVGNFIVRLNLEGTYVMTVWRTDAIHHYKINHSGSVWKFERAAITAEGPTLVDLLDTYMKSCTDKSVVPFGDGLHLVYDEPWNPPEVDMEQLSERLREEFSKSMSLESSTSVLPSQRTASSSKSTSDAKLKKTAMTPPKKQPSTSQHVTPPTAGQPAGSRGATISPIEKSESSSTSHSSLRQISLKPLVQPEPPKAAVAVGSESDDAVYQNWTSSQHEEDETVRNYENWTTEEGASGGASNGSPNEQIYENTTQRPTFVPPKKPMGKR